MPTIITLTTDGHGNLIYPKIEKVHVNSSQGGNVIKWQAGDNVDSFRLTPKDCNTTDPFRPNQPPTNFRNVVTCNVANTSLLQVWNYNILWKATPNGPVITVDPIIVIDPTGGIAPKKIILAALSAVVAACIPFAIKYIKRRLK